MLSVHQDGRVTVARGAAMARLVLLKLGVRRALQVAHLLSPRRFDASRRGVLLGGGIAAVGLLVGFPPFASVSSETIFTEQDATAQLDALTENPGVIAATRLLASRCKMDERRVGGGTDVDGTTSVMATYPALQNRADEAGVLLIRKSRSGTLAVEGGFAFQNQTSAKVSLEAAPAGIPDFVACVTVRTGAQCTEAAIICGEEYATSASFALLVICLRMRCGVPELRAPGTVRGNC